MARVAKNLSLDPEVVARAEKYALRAHTTVSRLVGDFLSRIVRMEEAKREGRGSFTPAVARLVGAGKRADGTGSVDDYHVYLDEKYGR
jgi:hypothetical protein